MHATRTRPFSPCLSHPPVRQISLSPAPLRGRDQGGRFPVFEYRHEGGVPWLAKAIVLDATEPRANRPTGRCHLQQARTTQRFPFCGAVSASHPSASASTLLLDGTTTGTKPPFLIPTHYHLLLRSHSRRLHPQPAALLLFACPGPSSLRWQRRHRLSLHLLQRI